MTDYTIDNADCLDILPTLEAQSIDAIICDLPYGVTNCAWDNVIPFAPMWAGIKRVLKPRGACVLFGSQPFTSALVMSNVEMFRYSLVWDKVLATGHLSVARRPMNQHDDILLFSREQNTYNPQYTARPVVRIRNARAKVTRTDDVYGDYNRPPERQECYSPKTILRYSNADRGVIAHPTQKPLALLEYLVKTYTNAGDTVLDFCMGSGTCGHACGNLGRRFVGIEKDAGYFAIAEERIATAYAPLRHMQQVAV